MKPNSALLRHANLHSRDPMASSGDFERHLSNEFTRGDSLSKLRNAPYITHKRVHCAELDLIFGCRTRTHTGEVGVPLAKESSCSHSLNLFRLKTEDAFSTDRWSEWTEGTVATAATFSTRFESRSSSSSWKESVVGVWRERTRALLNAKDLSL